MEDLKEWEFAELVSHATLHVVEEVFSGKCSLRSAVYWVCDVAARWGGFNYVRAATNAEQNKIAEQAATRIMRKYDLGRSPLTKPWLVALIHETRLAINKGG